MERLLVLRLNAVGCVAEAVLNGVPLGRVGSLGGMGQPGSLSLPVHEFTVSGVNDVSLVIAPHPPGTPEGTLEPEPQLADGQVGASLQLLLPRVGQSAHPSSARLLAQLNWAPAAGELYHAPVQQTQQVDLPIKFPRWRWLDAPPIEPSETLKSQLVAYLLGIALGLQRGDPEPLIQASRLRLEELALAYQRNLADDVGRLRVHLAQLHAAQPLKPPLPSATSLVLRWVAGGRLLECLHSSGAPFLQFPVAGGVHGWPLRVAQVEDKFYVLR